MTVERLTLEEVVAHLRVFDAKLDAAVQTLNLLSVESLGWVSLLEDMVAEVKELLEPPVVFDQELGVPVVDAQRNDVDARSLTPVVRKLGGAS